MEAVRILAQNLLEEIGLLKTKTEEIGRQLDNGGQISRAEIDDITHGLTAQEKIATELVNKTNGEELRFEESKDVPKEVSDLRKKVSEYEKRIACLEKENREKDISMANMNKGFQEFKAEMYETLAELRYRRSETENELTEMKDTLKRKQLVYDFEEALVIYIYPESCKIPTKNRFTSMKKWLNKNRKTPEGREANKKWKKLKKEFSWSRAHEKVFFKLIRYRIRYAHPNDDTELVEPETFTDKEKEYINVIVKMIDRVNDLIMG